MLTVVGLGNTGPSYRKTRHNAGFMLIDGILEGRFIRGAVFRRNCLDSIKHIIGFPRKFHKSSGSYESVEGELSGKEFLLVKPLTYMNESGKAVQSLRSRGIFKEVSELMVVVDDINISLGNVRLREKGSAGGHNGLQSVIDNLGTMDFPRLRIGVGPRPAGHEMVEYVLSGFTPEEFEVFAQSLEKASLIIEEWITGGFESFISELQTYKPYNTRIL